MAVDWLLKAGVFLPEKTSSPSPSRQAEKHPFPRSFSFQGLSLLFQRHRRAPSLPKPAFFPCLRKTPPCLLKTSSALDSPSPPFSPRTRMSTLLSVEGLAFLSLRRRVRWARRVTLSCTRRRLFRERHALGSRQLDPTEAPSFFVLEMPRSLSHFSANGFLFRYGRRGAHLSFFKRFFFSPPSATA